MRFVREGKTITLTLEGETEAKIFKVFVEGKVYKPGGIYIKPGAIRSDVQSVDLYELQQVKYVDKL